MSPREARPLIAPLILAFFLLSLGGLLLHLRLHNPVQTIFNWTPAGFGAVNAFVLPLLYFKSRTAGAAFLVTVATVVIGSLGMAYHSLITWFGPVTLVSVTLQSTLPDIIILASKLGLGWGIVRAHGAVGRDETARGCAT